MTTLYGSRGPCEVGAGWLTPSIAAMKFCHPILAEPEFICDSGARERAMHLALELTLQGDIRSEQAFIGFPSISSFRAHRTRSSLRVGFATDLEFYVGTEEDLQMTKVCLPESSFACGLTPWISSGCPRIAAMHTRQHQRVRDPQGNLLHPGLGTQLMAVAPFSQTHGYAEPFPLRSLSSWHADVDPLSSQAVCISSVAHTHFRRTDDSFYQFHALQSGLNSLTSWTSSSQSLDEVLGHDDAVNVRCVSELNLLPIHKSTFGPIEVRPDPNEVPNLPDPPVFSDASSNEGGRRDHRRPLHHFPSWTSALWNILQDEGATEVLEEGPVIYIGSYFVSHRMCPHQEQNRVLRLDAGYEHWGAIVQDTWRDYIDPVEPFEVHLVRPEPPIPITTGTVGIVIITQHPIQGREAILTTAMTDTIEGPQIQQSAHSCEAWTDTTVLLRLGGVLLGLKQE
eukprot:s296_g37.t1